MDDHSPNARQAPIREEANRGILPIWLRFLGLLALLVPIFVGLQHLLEREETMAAEAARAALPTPTAIVVEVPVTVERVVERTVYVPVPAPVETEAAPRSAAPEQAGQPPTEPAQEPTAAAPESPPDAPAEEAAEAPAPPDQPASAVAPIRPSAPIRRAPVWTPNYTAVVEPTEEETEAAPPQAEESPPLEEAAEAPAAPQPVEVVFQSEIGPSYRGLQVVDIAAEEEHVEAGPPPAPAPEQPAGGQDSVEALAVAAEGAVEPPAPAPVGAQPDHDVSTPEPVSFETGQ